MRILWYSKRWKKILRDRSMMFATSNRMRVFDNHEFIKDLPGVTSDVAGYTTVSPEPTRYDLVVFQKEFNRKLALLLRQSGIVTVWDTCDPVRIPKMTPWYVDGIIASNEMLAQYIRPQTRIPLRVVEDAHEADPQKIRTHERTDKLKVTCYGSWPSIEAGLRPLRPIFDKLGWIDFQYTDGQALATDEHPSYRKDVVFHMDYKEAARRPDSWQSFIYNSDVGLVPINNSIKSSNRILNYMAYGIPVICNPIPAYKALVRHGENGFFADTPEEWIRHLEALRDPELRRRMGQKARAEVLETFSMKAIADQYYEALMDITARSQTPKRSSVLKPFSRFVAKRLAEREVASVSS